MRNGLRTEPGIDLRPDEGDLAAGSGLATGIGRDAGGGVENLAGTGLSGGGGGGGSTKVTGVLRSTIKLIVWISFFVGSI